MPRNEHTATRLLYQIIHDKGRAQTNTSDEAGGRAARLLNYDILSRPQVGGRLALFFFRLATVVLYDWRCR